MYILSNIKKLYDGKSSNKESIKSNIDIIIENGLIKEVRPHQKNESNEFTIIDCSDLVITPGLVDCHAHITIAGIGKKDIDLMNSQSGLLYVEKILYTTLVNGGVTTARDIGGATDFIKRMINQNMMIGPRLKIAIAMLSSTGGHADFRGPDRCHAELSNLFKEAPGRPSSVVDSPWDCRKRVRELAACGADLIKICTSPGVASPSDKLEHREFTADEIEAICDEAQARGLIVAAHAHSRSGIELAITHGVKDIQHISFMDEKMAELAAKNNCTVTPTSWVIQHLQEMPNLTDFVKQKAAEVFKHHKVAVQAAHKAGLKILAGTDAIVPEMHGRNYKEIQSLIYEDIPTLTAWHGMTGLGAKEIGQEDTGTIEEGQRADLLIANQDVISSPDLFEKEALLEVIKDGEGYRNHFKEIPQRTFSSGLQQILENEDRPS
ncbi:MAG: amidohydrolase family protein [Bdellovibrionota bacterium]|nr:amidohydrolase family protein [Bdellovibrionota bacterium]